MAHAFVQHTTLDGSKYFPVTIINPTTRIPAFPFNSFIFRICSPSLRCVCWQILQSASLWPVPCDSLFSSSSSLSGSSVLNSNDARYGVLTETREQQWPMPKSFEKTYGLLRIVSGKRAWKRHEKLIEMYWSSASSRISMKNSFSDVPLVPCLGSVAFRRAIDRNGFETQSNSPIAFHWNSSRIQLRIHPMVDCRMPIRQDRVHSS